MTPPAWYRFLEFRYYRPLQQPEHEAAAKSAKECLRRVVAEARDWGMEFYLGVTELNVPERLITVSPHLFHTNAAGRTDARVVCATFFHHPEGERAFAPLCGRLPARCEGRMKMQVEDFYRFHDPTTLAGRISPGREWIEMDPGGEHRAGTDGNPCAGTSSTRYTRRLRPPAS